MDGRAEKLRRLQANFTQRMDEFKQWAASGYKHENKPPSRPFPDDLRDIRCEARTRAGTPCKRKDICLNGRCKYHGGKSTGAKTAEGKARQLEGYRMWQERQKKNG